jgi:hypothetical protein
MKAVLCALLFPAALTLLLWGCKRESFTTDGELRLRISTDTLHFDTVFTSTGSVTQSLKVFNPHTRAIRIQSVRLAGNAASLFRINVDGTPGPQVTDVEIRANDSTYIFATVSINPSVASLPFLVRDSIEIAYNGNRQYVQLDAFGQNAHFLRNKRISGNEVWNADLPYVILGGLTVDSNATLTINRGCRVYLHADAPLLVHGTLQALGGKEDSNRVVFTSDRLDDPYRDYPAGYPGLFFTDYSRNNLLSYTTIKNAFQGVVVTGPAPSTAPKLRMNESTIHNAYDAGLTGVQTSISARNLLISNCGKNILLLKGGVYDFTHCTVTAFSNRFLPHKSPLLFVSNEPENGAIPSSLTALFRNCLFWGESGNFVEDEIVVSGKSTSGLKVQFEGVLWQVKNSPTNATISGAVVNKQDPSFDSVNTNRNYYDFRLKAGSPALNKGVNAGINIDLNGAPRPVGIPDLGAFERQ